MYPQSQQPQQGPGDRLTMAGSFNGAVILANAHALTCTVFIRTDFGREGIGIHGLIAALMILGYASFAESTPMFIFFLLWLLAVICQRIRQFRNWKRGVIVHSRYNGYPYLSRRIFPWISELNARGVDAFLCLGGGWLLGQFSQPLGWFVMMGFVSIMFSETVMVESTRKRLQAMRDAEIEQRYLAEQYKSGRF